MIALVKRPEEFIVIQAGFVRLKTDPVFKKEGKTNTKYEYGFNKNLG